MAVARLVTHLGEGGSPPRSSGTLALALGRFLEAREQRHPRPAIEAGARAGMMAPVSSPI